jgi:hypothetical protein
MAGELRLNLTLPSESKTFEETHQQGSVFGIGQPRASASASRKTPAYVAGQPRLPR